MTSLPTQLVVERNKTLFKLGPIKVRRYVVTSNFYRKTVQSISLSYQVVGQFLGIHENPCTPSLKKVLKCSDLLP